MLEQLNDPYRRATGMKYPRQEYVLPITPMVDIEPMVESEQRNKNIWLKRRDFFNRNKKLSGTIITTNSILFDVENNELELYL